MPNTGSGKTNFSLYIDASSNMAIPRKQHNGQILWLGGTSSLTRTFVNEFGCRDLVLVGSKTRAPPWVYEQSIPYFSLNLQTVSISDVEELASRFSSTLTIVVGVRPKLFAPYIHTVVGAEMNEGLRIVLSILCKKLMQLKFILHLSSVAVANHLKSQHCWDESMDLPDFSEYQAPYDIFKRRCEDDITEICKKHKVQFCHLRLGAIFSDESECIQCSALGLQSRMGCYLPLPIDCNSGVNVSRAINLLIAAGEAELNQKVLIKKVYFYTRPLALRKPVAYGYYLEAFRSAHRLNAVWIPAFVVGWFVAAFHWFASWSKVLQIPYIDAADYLLQVAAREHSFDCSSFATDFPELKEESIPDCFVRRKTVLQSYTQIKKSWYM